MGADSPQSWEWDAPLSICQHVYYPSIHWGIIGDYLETQFDAFRYILKLGRLEFRVEYQPAMFVVLRTNNVHLFWLIDTYTGAASVQ